MQPSAAISPAERARRRAEMPLVPAGKLSTADPAAAIADAGAVAWPMPVAEFLKGPWLEPADVLLMRKRRSLFAWLVRTLSGGRFSKAALVFLVPHRDRDFEKPFVIEAGFSGVDLADLASFLSVRSPKGRWNVAVKRLEAPWFGDKQRAHLRGLLLAQIKARYDFRRLLWNLAAALARSGFVSLRLLVGTRRALLGMRGAAGRGALDRVIGPGLIQWSFYRSATELASAQAVPEAALADVRFFRDADGAASAVATVNHAGVASAFGGGVGCPDDEVLLSVTADDLAASPRLAWRFAIVDGLVHRVGSAAEFQSVVAAARRRTAGGLEGKAPGDRQP